MLYMPKSQKTMHVICERKNRLQKTRCAQVLRIADRIGISLIELTESCFSNRSPCLLHAEIENMVQ